MKIGIITFNSAHNFGAVLQAWSLQEYLKSQGHTVEIINFRHPMIDKVYQLPEHPTGDQVKAYRRFERFISKSLRITGEFTSFRELKKADFTYDALITGSDQVWNSTITKGINPAYLLAFGPTGARRIAYAVSIGTETVPEQEKEMLTEHLKHFDFISVREKAAYEGISLLTDKKVVITADPTFLLQREEFYRLRQRPKGNHKYIYVHNVHLKRIDERLNEVAEELSARTGLPVVYNRNNYHYKNTFREVPEIGPEEFLGWVEKASYVVTNSFHATTFAIIFQRNFITVPALRNPGRMQELLERLELSSHLIGSKEEVPSDLNQLIVDYDGTGRKIEEYVRTSKEFLNTALKSSEYNKSVETSNEVVTLAYRPSGYPVKSFYANPLLPFCQEVIRQGGVVITRGFGLNMQSEYQLMQTVDELEHLFVESIVEAELQQGIGLVKAQLRMGKNVLFLGNACETRAVKQEAEAPEENSKHGGKLITINTACESCVTQEEYVKYKEAMEIQYGAELTYLSFANRIRGWVNPYVCVKFQNEEVRLTLKDKDKLVKLTQIKYEKQPKCSLCNQDSCLTESTDLSLLPNRIKNSDDQYVGNYLLAVHSEQGRELFRKCAEAFIIFT